MEKPNITKETTETLLETKFLKVFDLQYAPGKHATRRSKENLVALQSEELCKTMLPDAVTCIVVLQKAAKEAKLLLTYEFRYPTGQFLLSPPAGLIDPQDKQTEQPLLETAAREIQEETGLTIEEHDSMHVVNSVSVQLAGHDGREQRAGVRCAASGEFIASDAGGSRWLRVL